MMSIPRVRKQPLTVQNTMSGNIPQGAAPRRNKGFTLIELLIVMSIVGILAAIAVPNYKWGLIKAREAVLSESLYGLRSAIDQFYADQGKYPDSLEELVSKGYFNRSLPNDPFTKAADWVPLPPTSLPDGGEVKGSVGDVQSASDLIGTNGKAYKDW